MVENREVVVVGAGPVGLALALGLARRDVDVLVLEKEARTSEHSRAPAIWPRTQEVLADLSVLDRCLESGISLSTVELRDVDRDRPLLRLTLDELRDETECARLLILPQSKTERLLCEAVERTGTCEIRFSSEVVGVAQDGSRATARYRANGGEATVEATILVGCDGAHSCVRDEIGGHLAGLTYAAEVALADVRLTSGPSRSALRFSTQARLAIAIPLGADQWRLILPLFGGDERSVKARVKSAVQALFSQDAYETLWTSTFRLHRRTSSRWLDGRVVLAGDAAHLNSPVGGQGMNAGIIDAAVLTDAIVAALASDKCDLLQAYVAQRRRAVEQGTNPFTDRLTRVLLMAGRGSLTRPALRSANGLLRIAPVRHAALRRMALLDQERTLLSRSPPALRD